MKRLSLLLAFILTSCASVKSFNAYLNRKNTTEAAIEAAQSDVTAAGEARAEQWATDKFDEAKNFLNRARNMMEEQDFEGAQGAAAQASGAAQAARSMALAQREDSKHAPKQFCFGLRFFVGDGTDGTVLGRFRQEHRCSARHEDAKPHHAGGFFSGALHRCGGRAEESADHIPIRMNVLNEFSGEKRKPMLRHLVSSAKWKLVRERGGLFAFRRTVTDGCWVGDGYHSDFDDSISPPAHFQYRIMIAPDGPVSVGSVTDGPWGSKATRADAEAPEAKIKVVDDKLSNHGLGSCLIVQSKGAAVEIFEQSRRPRRKFTALALRQIDKELTLLLTSSKAAQESLDFSLMPKASMKIGEPEFQIANGMQGGI